MMLDVDVEVGCCHIATNSSSVLLKELKIDWLDWIDLQVDVMTHIGSR